MSGEMRDDDVLTLTVMCRLNRRSKYFFPFFTLTTCCDCECLPTTDELKSKVDTEVSFFVAQIVAQKSAVDELSVSAFTQTFSHISVIIDAVKRANYFQFHGFSLFTFYNATVPYYTLELKC